MGYSNIYFAISELWTLFLWHCSLYTLHTNTISVNFSYHQKQLVKMADQIKLNGVIIYLYNNFEVDLTKNWLINEWIKIMTLLLSRPYRCLMKLKFSIYLSLLLSTSSRYKSRWENTALLHEVTVQLMDWYRQTNVSCTLGHTCWWLETYHLSLAECHTCKQTINF